MVEKGREAASFCLDHECVLIKWAVRPICAHPSIYHALLARMGRAKLHQLLLLCPHEIDRHIGKYISCHINYKLHPGLSAMAKTNVVSISSVQNCAL